MGKVSGQGQWARSVGKVNGQGQWARSMGKVSGQGQWERAMGKGKGGGQRGNGNVEPRRQERSICTPYSNMGRTAC